jgi:hypothetical protein
VKTRINTYREVDKLPANAVVVADFAESRDCLASNIYKLWRNRASPNKTVGRKKKPIDFEIVIFKGINFVIPNKLKSTKA